MSEVKSFKMEFQPDGVVRECVYAEDFNRVTAERDALQQRLTATDEALDSTKAEMAWQESDNAELRTRVGVLEELLVRCHRADILSQNCGLWKDLDAALKPAEGGGDVD